VKGVIWLTWRLYFFIYLPIKGSRKTESTRSPPQPCPNGYILWLFPRDTL